MLPLTYYNEDNNNENQIILSSQNNSQNDEIIISNNQLINNNNNNGMNLPINNNFINTLRNGFNRYNNMIDNRFEHQNNLITNLQNQNNQLQLQLKQQNEEIQNDLNNIKNRNMTENEMQFRRSAASILSGYSENQQIQNISVDGLINNNNFKNIYEQNQIENINLDFINDFSNDFSLNERIKLNNNNNLKEIKQINPFQFNQKQQDLLNKDFNFQDIIKKDECTNQIDKVLNKSDTMLTLNKFNNNEKTFITIKTLSNNIFNIFNEKGTDIKNEKYKNLYKKFVLWLVNKVNEINYDLNFNLDSIGITRILTIYKYLVTNYSNNPNLPKIILFYTETYFKSLSSQEEKNIKINDFNELLKIMQQVANQTVILSDNLINLTGSVNVLINDNYIQSSLNEKIIQKVLRILQMIDLLKDRTNINIANMNITNENLRNFSNEIISEINGLIMSDRASKSAYDQLLNLVNRLNLLFNSILANDKYENTMNALGEIIQNIENLKNHDFPDFQKQKLQEMFSVITTLMNTNITQLNEASKRYIENLRNESLNMSNEINQKILKMEKENKNRDLLVNELQNVIKELSNQKVDIINDINILKNQNEQITNAIKTIAEQNNKFSNSLKEINTILSNTNENIKINNEGINDLKEITKDLSNRIKNNENRINQQSLKISIIESQINELKNQINELGILNKNKIIENKTINKGKSLGFEYERRQEFITDINNYINLNKISSDYNLDYDRESIPITDFLFNQLQNFERIRVDEKFNIVISDASEKKLYYLQFLSLIYSKIFYFTWEKDIQKEILMRQTQIKKIMENINDFNNELEEFINNQIKFINILIEESKNKSIYRKLDYDSNNFYTTYRIIIDNLINSINEKNKDKIERNLTNLSNIFNTEYFKKYLNNNNDIGKQFYNILQKLKIGGTLLYDDFIGYILDLINIINQFLSNYKNNLKNNLSKTEKRKFFNYEKNGNIHQFKSNSN